MTFFSPISLIHLAFSLLPLTLTACGDNDDPSDATADTTADTAPDCGGCPSGKVCCPSRFTDDIPRCVDTTLNPENCGSCGTFCGGACEASKCVDSPTCGDGAPACPGDLVCSTTSPTPSGEGRCCPPGTSLLLSLTDFFGCCPDGDICGCREGACPISLRSAKTDIRYLDSAEVAALGRELLAVQLATWRYRSAPDDHRQLGFIIDDGLPRNGIARDGGHVDLYGYISVAVAALQVQSRELDTLRAEVDDLKRRLDALTR